MLYIGKMEENIWKTQRNFEAKAQTAKDNREWNPSSETINKGKETQKILII